MISKAFKKQTMYSITTCARPWTLYVKRELYLAPSSLCILTKYIGNNEVHIGWKVNDLYYILYVAMSAQSAWVDLGFDVHVLRTYPTPSFCLQYAVGIKQGNSLVSNVRISIPVDYSVCRTSSLVKSRDAPADRNHASDTANWHQLVFIL